MRRLFALCLAVASVALPAAAAAPASCPGNHGAPTGAVTGSFPASLEGASVLVPFDVPPGTTSLRVKLCYDQPQVAQSGQIRNTLDLGLYEPSNDGFWDAGEFRGWGGSSRLNAVLSPIAETTPGAGDGTTVGFMPGPIPPGRWAAEIGVAAITDHADLNPSPEIGWRIEVFARAGESFPQPWSPAAYDTTPARSEPGWYRGDFHVHAEHSNPSDAPMRETFDYAFGARPSGAGLDFITLSDYVGGRQWDEIGRFQADYPGKLVVRSSEVITYRGHINNHGSARVMDYRTGALYRWDDGAPTLLRPTRPASAIFSDIRDAGGWTQVNHPTIFPSKVPPFANLCRGCSWEYTDAETEWSLVDAFEVTTGPAGMPDPQGNELGPNPFTPLAIEWWDRLWAQGYRITAVGASDSHKAGRQTTLQQDPNQLTRSPIGEGTTVVYANELSETGIAQAVRAGHAYVKFFAADGPDLRLTATAGSATAMMGDTLTAQTATLTASVLGGMPSPQPRVLAVYRSGVRIAEVPVVSEPFTLELPIAVPGHYRLQLERGSAIEALTNPITLAWP